MKKLILSFCIIGVFGMTCNGQSPELSLREFASGQIKKGVRSIGMGGNGATWGNYALVWRDTCTALLDGGVSKYPNSNTFSFTAVGYNTPSLWHGLAIYAIALSQYADNIKMTLKFPGFGSVSAPAHGNGTNQAIFVKAAMPLGKGFSAGVLLSYERSQFNATSDISSSDHIQYLTGWLPSGGFGLTWQPSKRILVGCRALFNNDMEKRIDRSGTFEGLNATAEYRFGASVGLWKGALIDIGGNTRSRSNKIANTHQTDTEPNIGIEQNLFRNHFAIRTGIDETSGTGGMSIRVRPIVIDIAYVHDLAKARLGSLFGTNSDSFIATFIFNYNSLKKRA